MFVTVLFGDCVDLMDRSGTVMSLVEKEQSVEPASLLLVERSIYVLLRVCRSEDSEGQKHVPLLNNLSKNHPELSDMLKKMSNPNKKRGGRNGSFRKGWTQKDSSVTQSRNKNTSANKSHLNK
ncbi:uncharacterized protein LOC130125091 isoform X2 [Lampris incognitus]|uniref:uncharacterized protein LOC130125091 isoform X2 n=1 Tax=Lampris incognitus TaxID=2546036 RepID=UPI0024B5A1A0|nr:uncharacterized protein LOC130125091 isoform X2 [Lampris incognitus]